MLHILYQKPDHIRLSFRVTAGLNYLYRLLNSIRSLLQYRQPGLSPFTFNFTSNLYRCYSRELTMTKHGSYPVPVKAPVADPGLVRLIDQVTKACHDVFHPGRRQLAAVQGCLVRLVRNAVTAPATLGRGRH